MADGKTSILHQFRLYRPEPSYFSHRRTRCGEQRDVAVEIPVPGGVFHFDLVEPWATGGEETCALGLQLWPAGLVLEDRAAGDPRVGIQRRRYADRILRAFSSVLRSIHRVWASFTCLPQFCGQIIVEDGLERSGQLGGV